MMLPRRQRVDDASQAGEARRAVDALCRALGFGALRTAQAALVATELATNLVKHSLGAGGELVFTPLLQADATGLEILSLDRGPGIANVALCLRDGHSSAGTAGTGLGAIRRQSSTFDIFSAPGQGTAVLSRLWRDAPPAVPPALALGAVCLPVQGETENGDAWAVRYGPLSTRFLLVDGLGHGPDAAAASALAVALFEQNAQRPLEPLLQLIHAGLRGTRGAAVALAEWVAATGLVHFVGVGNLSGRLLDGGRNRHMLSHNGTAGVEARKIQVYPYPWPAGGLMVLHSDGLAAHWSLAAYPGLADRDPALIAGMLYRDHQRPRDDSTVVVARVAASNAVHGPQAAP